MKAQSSEINASSVFSTTMPRAERHAHHDWSFLPTAAGGLLGVVIGLGFGMLLGWC
jgi:hypothetical protein